jgi:hypothetical protein
MCPCCFLMPQTHFPPIAGCAHVVVLMLLCSCRHCTSVPQDKFVKAIRSDGVVKQFSYVPYSTAVVRLIFWSTETATHVTSVWAAGLGLRDLLPLSWFTHTSNTLPSVAAISLMWTSPLPVGGVEHTNPPIIVMKGTSTGSTVPRNKFAEVIAQAERSNGLN